MTPDQMIKMSHIIAVAMERAKRGNRVFALHAEMDGVCQHCLFAYPCRTIQLLDGHE